MEESKFNLWRATFSFCFVDGFLSKEEQKYIEEKLKVLKFTDQQKTVLLKDLTSPANFSSLIPLISKPADRGFLINNVRLLARIDNDLSSTEKADISKVTKEVLSKLDMPGLNEQIADNEKASYHEDEVYKVHNKHSYFEAVITNLLKICNPGDYKFPKNDD